MRKREWLATSAGLVFILAAGCDLPIASKTGEWDLGMIDGIPYRAEVWCIPSLGFDERLLIYRADHEALRFTLRRYLDLRALCEGRPETVAGVEIEAEKKRIKISTGAGSYFLPFTSGGILQRRPPWANCIDRLAENNEPP